VRSQSALARVARERGDLELARARIEEALAGAAALPPDAPEAARAALEAAWLRLDEGDPGEAVAEFAAAEGRARRALGAADPSIGWALAGRGEALRRSADRAGARAALDEALRRFAGEANAETIRPAEPLGAVAALISLGALLREEGDLDGAREALRDAAAIGGRELGTDHPRVAAALAELAQVERARGDLEAATRAASRAVEIARARLPDGHATRRAAEAALAALGPRSAF
jgi:tetratricopeptide (TPR) repeat protein